MGDFLVDDEDLGGLGSWLGGEYARHLYTRLETR